MASNFVHNYDFYVQLYFMESHKQISILTSHIGINPVTFNSIPVKPYEGPVYFGGVFTNIKYILVEKYNMAIGPGPYIIDPFNGLKYYHYNNIDVKLIRQAFQVQVHSSLPKRTIVGYIHNGVFYPSLINQLITKNAFKAKL